MTSPLTWQGESTFGTPLGIGYDGDDSVTLYLDTGSAQRDVELDPDTADEMAVALATAAAAARAAGGAP